MRPIEAMSSITAGSPVAIRVGIARGAVGGSSERTRAKRLSGLSGITTKERKNGTSRTRPRGVAADEASD